MRKPETWQLAIIVLIVSVAVYVALGIEHPDWAKNLLSWQPAGQRDIALRYGLDLQGGLQIVLAADVPEEEDLDAELMEATRRVIENRVSDLELTKPVVQVQGERQIVVQLPGIRERHQITETVQATGLVEFIDSGTIFLQPGTVVETTLGGPSEEEPAELPTPAVPIVTPTPPLTPTATATVTPTVPVTPTTPITPTAPITPTTTPARVYDTVLSSDDLAVIALRRTGQDSYNISFVLTLEATSAFDVHLMIHAGQFLCIALDKESLSCARLPDEPFPRNPGEPASLSIPAFLPDEDGQNTSVLLRYGPLPVPLRVERVEPLGPTLGETSVQRSGHAVLIGLIALFFFLPLHYRLPGLLADLALLILGLLNLALCKVIPLPLTLPSITGFGAAAVLAIGGQLSAFERLREEMRAGQLPSRAIEPGFSRSWPSIRATHVAFLATSIVVWYIGAAFATEAIHWLGITLTVGVLTSLIVTMVVTRTFVRLTFGAAWERLSERKWLLGV